MRNIRILLGDDHLDRFSCRITVFDGWPRRRSGANVEGPMWITGQVVDDRGRALPNVTIEVSGPHTSPRHRGVTNAHGHYVLQDLRPGSYTITFTRSGFSTVQRKTDALTTYVATINARLHERRTG